MGSLPDPRYCAMGERCLAPNGPEKLSRYNKDKICRWCSQGRNTRTDMPVEGDVEGRLGALLKAAPVLMEQDASTDRIFPTLAFAGYVIGQGVAGAIDRRNRLLKEWGKPEAWEARVTEFVSQFPGVRPVGVEGETVILQQDPCSIEVVCYPQTDIPEAVKIHVYPQRLYTSPEEIADRYVRKLTAAGIACDFEDRHLPISADPLGGRLVITVPNHEPDMPTAHASVVWRDEQPRFPHPEMVKGYYKYILGTKASNGSARYLGMRDRKPDRVSASSLVPACVALCLQDVGHIKQRKSVHRLLNQHVYVGQFEDAKIPEDGSDKGKENALWDQIDNPKLAYKVKRPLYIAVDAFLSPK
jgi:hypothetical protein